MAKRFEHKIVSIYLVFKIKYETQKGRMHRRRNGKGREEVGLPPPFPSKGNMLRITDASISIFYPINQALYVLFATGITKGVNLPPRCFPIMKTQTDSD